MIPLIFCTIFFICVSVIKFQSSGVDLLSVYRNWFSPQVHQDFVSPTSSLEQALPRTTASHFITSQLLLSDQETATILSTAVPASTVQVSDPLPPLTSLRDSVPSFVNDDTKLRESSIECLWFERHAKSLGLSSTIPSQFLTPETKRNIAFIACAVTLHLLGRVFQISFVSDAQRGSRQASASDLNVGDAGQVKELLVHDLVLEVKSPHPPEELHGLSFETEEHGIIPGSERVAARALSFPQADPGEALPSLPLRRSKSIPSMLWPPSSDDDASSLEFDSEPPLKRILVSSSSTGAALGALGRPVSRHEFGVSVDSRPQKRTKAKARRQRRQKLALAIQVGGADSRGKASMTIQEDQDA